MNGTWWKNGVCPRGHDITDPANVRTVRRRTDRKASRRCRTCDNDAKRARRKGTPVPPPVWAEYPPHDCAICGKTFTVDDLSGRRLGLAWWESRRYCSAQCGRAAIARDRWRPPLSPDCARVLPPCSTCGVAMVRQRTANFAEWRAHGFAMHGVAGQCRSCYARYLRGAAGPARMKLSACRPDPAARCLDCRELICDHRKRPMRETELARLRRLVGVA